MKEGLQTQRTPSSRMQIEEPFIIVNLFPRNIAARTRVERGEVNMMVSASGTGARVTE